MAGIPTWKRAPLPGHSFAVAAARVLITPTLPDWRLGFCAMPLKAAEPSWRALWQAAPLLSGVPCRGSHQLMHQRQLAGCGIVAATPTGCHPGQGLAAGVHCFTTAGSGREAGTAARWCQVVALVSKLAHLGEAGPSCLLTARLSSKSRAGCRAPISASLSTPTPSKASRAPASLRFPVSRMAHGAALTVSSRTLCPL